MTTLTVKVTIRIFELTTFSNSKFMPSIVFYPEKEKNGKIAPIAFVPETFTKKTAV